MLMPAEAPGTPMRKLERRSQCVVIEAHGGVEHSRRVCRIYLEGGVVRGDDADACGTAEVVGDGHRQRGALFGIGGRAQLVQQNQRLRGRLVRDEIDVGNMRRKRRKVLLDGLVVANVGEHAIEDGHLGALGGKRNTRLRHQRQQPDRLERHGFAAGVGAADDQLTMLGVEFDGQRNHGNALGFQGPLQQRVARVAHDQRRRRIR